MVGIVFQQQAQAAIAAADIYGMLKMLASQQTPDSHFLGFIFVIAPFPVAHVVMGWVVVLVGAFFGRNTFFGFVFHMRSSISLLLLNYREAAFAHLKDI